MPPTTHSDFDVTEAMLTYGGSFVQMLGRLFRLADDENTRRLKAAFPEYWGKYASLARAGKDLNEPPR